MREADVSEVKSGNKQFISILNKEEWNESRELFDMGIEIDPNETDIVFTKAEVNYDSITGTFSLPNRSDFSKPDTTFAFALDEKGVVFIDNSGVAEIIVKQISSEKKRRKPSLESFLYSFIDKLTYGDQEMLSRYEWELYGMESAITRESDAVPIDRVNDIRGDVRDLNIHYEQLLDVIEVFEENENSFFSKSELRYFRLLSDRVERLRDTSASISDYTMQIRDLYKMHLDIKQNNIMTVLTAVTTIFMPLTLIVGWYGMNFRYMPELEYRWSYPILAVISVIIVAINVYVFKQKNGCEYCPVTDRSIISETFKNYYSEGSFLKKLPLFQKEP